MYRRNTYMEHWTIWCSSCWKLAYQIFVLYVWIIFRVTALATVKNKDALWEWGMAKDESGVAVFPKQIDLILAAFDYWLWDAVKALRQYLHTSFSQSKNMQLTALVFWCSMKDYTPLSLNWGIMCENVV